MAEERLQKVLAAAGVASRRACEALITEGRVQVNGRTITELGTKVDPQVVQLAVDGKPVQLPKRHVYIKLHKPRGVLGDVGGDTDGRQTVADLLPDEMRRLFPVGRLDLHSEGLVLMTDDGELAHRLTHPRFEHAKTYYVLVERTPEAAALEQLRNGVDLPEGRTAPAEVRVVSALPPELHLSKGPNEGVWLEIMLREGKKRQIRHMTAAVGYPTLRLVRWAIGPLTLGTLKLREQAPLSRREVAALKSAAGGGAKSARMRRANAKRARNQTAAKPRRSRSAKQQYKQNERRASGNKTQGSSHSQSSTQREQRRQRPRRPSR
ncbi:MAG: rRNA pseudouridine synthase [Caldilineaceae bacterium]|nr:rRNA pseudouridine synthase [Caldilineaceae bacterium]